MASIKIDPAGAYIKHGDQMFYRDGIIYGMVLPDEDEQEHSLQPTLWSKIVANYRRKVVEVQAIQLAPDNVEEVANWCGGLIVEEQDPLEEDKTYVALNIPTHDGPIRASEEDYVIRGNDGQFFVRHPSDFAREYEVS